MRFPAAVSISIATLASLGCAAESMSTGAAGAAGAAAVNGALGSTSDSADDVMTSSSPLQDGVEYKTIIRDFTLPPNTINPSLPADQWMCALGLVSGNLQDTFVANASDVEVRNGFWFPNAYPADQVIVHGNCVRINTFTGEIPPGQTETTRWLSDEFWLWRRSSSCGAFGSTATAWWGDAATFMTGIEGGMFGGGELVSIEQSEDPSSPSELWVDLCQGSLTVVGRSIFVGIPSSGRQVKFKGPGGVGSAAAAGEYAVDRGIVTMARKDEAFCYFTHIQGAFAGAGEMAEITTVTDAFDNESWALHTRSQQGMLYARARCVLYDQTLAGSN